MKPKAGLSNANNTANITSNINTKSTSSTVTISQVEFKVMQAFMLQHSATAGFRLISAPSITSVYISGAVFGPAPGTAPGLVIALLVDLFILVVATFYCGKAPKID